MIRSGCDSRRPSHSYLSLQVNIRYNLKKTHHDKSDGMTEIRLLVVHLVPTHLSIVFCHASCIVCSNQILLQFGRAFSQIFKIYFN